MHSKISWTKLWARDYGTHVMYFVMHGFSRDKELLKSPVQHVAVSSENGLLAIFVPEQENAAVNQALKQHYVRDLEKLQAYIDLFLDEAQEIVRKLGECSKGVRKVSDSELLGRYEELTRLFFRYYVHLWITFILNDLVSAEVGGRISSLSLEESERAALLEYATTPSKLSSVLLLNEEARTKSVEQLAREYPWITTIDFDENPAGIEQIRERIHGGDARPAGRPAAYEGLEAELQAMLEMGRQTTYVKDVRDDFRRKGIHAAIPLFEEIAQRLGLTRNDLAYLVPPEISAALAGKALADLGARAARRRDTGVLMLLEGGDQFSLYDEPEEVQAKVDNLGLYPKSEEAAGSNVKGIPGCKGKVRGSVKIVITTSDISKVTDGDIMCSVTTNPDYLPAMQRAAAFVTDEGGITCHAAIVAREMGKPCIVGTKNGTKLLREGMLVEVDATAGTVVPIS